MSIDLNDDILQDFLIEAGEILEQLGEQLVELEQNPSDADLLNAIFRGFHTVKGGAGFLSLEPMVEVCHRSEDVFNLLRNDELSVDSDMMDAFLRVLDILNDQFASINEGEDPPSADKELLDKLECYLRGEKPPASNAEAAAETPVAEVPASEAAEEGDITDDEFEALLDVMQGKGDDDSARTKAEKDQASDSDDITDDEFEALLDDLHGKGKHGGTVSESAASADEANTKASDEITDHEFEALLDDLHGKGKHSGTVPAGKDASAAGNDSDEISEDEFDALMDNLHGKGKGPTATDNSKPASKEQPEKTQQPAKAAAEKKPQAAKPAAAKKPAAKAEATVRVDTGRLDDIMNMVGELVLVRNRLSTLKVAMKNEEVSKAVANLDIVTADLQTAVMKTRMQPIKKIFGRFPRVVRDLARSLKKEVKLEMVGEETDLDKNLVEALADPMVHLVRNSVDHGIEMPDVREQNGKPSSGTVILAAAQEGDHILLTISDDGAGMDPDVLRGKAVEKGLMDEDAAKRLEDRECFDLIFSPGFSTKTEITDVSGRGVGMDVVKTRITQLNGSIEIDSRLGKGTQINVKLPLTLAILPTLMVKVGDRTYALPLSSVSEIFHLDKNKTNIVDGQLTVMVRDKAMPLFYLRKWLDRNNTTDRNPDELDQVVVAHIGNQRVGFVVNQVVGQEEVVIKPLGSMLHGLPGFAGATITGDGRIALILDMPSLLKSHVGRY
jgi:two-component system chemotaxis sensor kinase CheA